MDANTPANALYNPSESKEENDAVMEEAQYHQQIAGSNNEEYNPAETGISEVEPPLGATDGNQQEFSADEYNTPPQTELTYDDEVAPIPSIERLSGETLDVSARSTPETTNVLEGETPVIHSAEETPGQSIHAFTDYAAHSIPTTTTTTTTEALDHHPAETLMQTANMSIPSEEDGSTQPTENAPHYMDIPEESMQGIVQQQPAEGLTSSMDTVQQSTTKTSNEPAVSNDEKDSQNAPFMNTPASWQIPPGALQAKAEPNPPKAETESKATIKRKKLEQRVKESPYDVDAWQSLIAEVQQTGDLPAIRDEYERFLKVFPTSPRHWLAYLELELKYSNFNEVEALFTRCLKTVLSVDLWKFYLGYIRRINRGENGTAATSEARTVIERAYEFVLENVGIDKDAGPIWADYIFFIKSAETTNTWEEQRKMDSMRRAYQKAVTIPLNNVEHLWKEYDRWEHSLNGLTAKKFLGEKSSAYMTARTALPEMRRFTDNLNRNAVPKPPQWTDKELQQLDLWKQYIRWEKSNPLQLDEESLVNERVIYAYQQAFLVLRFYPELWYDYAQYYLEQGKIEKAMDILKQATEVLPTSLLVHFSYAELCESQRQLTDARKAFESLLERLDQDVEKIKSGAQKEIDRLQQEADEERAGLKLTDDIDGELREQLRQREKQVKKEQDEVEKQCKEQVDVIAKSCSLVWINYMQFARRTEGIKVAREVFSKARRATNRTYHVFVASALMEYHNSKNPTIAGKIFGLGIKIFPEDPDYICEYLDFLIQMNDDNNTRALFERTLATMATEKSEPVWAKFLEYESKYGDLASVQNVEKRRNEAIPGKTPLESLLDRYGYLNINSISELELGGQARKQKLPEVPSDLPSSEAVLAKAKERARQKDAHGKRPLLEPVHPERYPRPDLNQWVLFKPSPAEPVRRPAGTAAPPVPVQETVAPPEMSAPPPAAVAPPAPMAWKQQQPPPAPVQQALPEPVAYFVSNLPSAQKFNGPIIQAAELVDLLRNIIIPLPPQGGPPPLAGAGRGPMSQPPKNVPPMHPPPGRDMPPMRGGYGGGPAGRGRGAGFKARGGMPMRGGKQGMKRRQRDDYDDDYQSHKGMGPNRPPEFDLFRQRQVKRHRDEPPY
ncbi:mRNA 3'-end-processing protein rna14 [Apophysomyces ossiformis]|uniref:mRNA 3'-end-processing protein rna14 n=1 Tax=Apophysomyces ossiformis TaxID=679940 RepID=A0A8H7EML7_9FUNG|nr:mRNA 3'-end-processing protein rna14 [Apophysomyces ossiformis]